VVTALLVIFCGGAGAIARFAVDSLVGSRQRRELPLGTFAVNVVGCFLLGLLAGLHASSHLTLVLGTATLGSYTTFSTWMLETHRPAQDGDPAVAWANVGLSLALGLAAAVAGRALGGAL
jgi:fluoride exporter